VTERVPYRSASFDPGAYDLSQSTSGDADLDARLRDHAAAAGQARVAQTFVWTESDSARVLTYYASSAHAVPGVEAPSRIARGVVNPVPAALILSTGARAVLVQSPVEGRPNVQRQLCLQRLVVTAADLGVARLQIEQDDSVVEFDRKVVFNAVKAGLFSEDFTYAWLRPRQEPLLWVADAFAWCWAQGGPWRVAIRDAVDFIDLNDPN